MEDSQNINPGMNVHICASCKSENIQKLSLAYMAGSSEIQGVGLGVGMGGGVGLGTGMGTSQTLLSKRAAPPMITSPLFCAFGIWLLCLGVFSILPVALPENTNGLLALFIILAFFATFWPPVRFYRYLNVKKKAEMEEYNKKYICLRCGNIFQLN
jgi:hypothetical protein